MMFFHKKNRYELDMTTANNALQNILSSCNQPVNTIPFDKLVLRKKVNAASYNRLIVATTLIFVLTFLSPLAIVPLSEMTEKLLAPTPAVLTLDYVENNILSLKFTGDNILYEEAFMETVKNAASICLDYGWRIHADEAQTGEAQGWFNGFPEAGLPAPVPGESTALGRHSVIWYENRFEAPLRASGLSWSWRGRRTTQRSG